jgi:hypothetical protein
MSASETLAAAGYSENQIREGMAYADAIGWDDEDDRGALALARILYSDEQLADNTRAPWEKTE